jgi:hypothetical protein
MGGAMGGAMGGTGGEAGGQHFGLPPSLVLRPGEMRSPRPGIHTYILSSLYRRWAQMASIPLKLEG